MLVIAIVIKQTRILLLSLIVSVPFFIIFFTINVVRVFKNWGSDPGFFIMGLMVSVMWSFSAGWLTFIAIMSVCFAFISLKSKLSKPLKIVIFPILLCMFVLSGAKAVDIIMRSFGWYPKDYADRLEYPHSEKTQPPIALDYPVEFQMKQRSTIALSGSNDRIFITIDDITRGQVMTSLSWNDGGIIVTSRSMRENDHVTFKVEDHEYKIKLKQLTNVLVGEDTARFELSLATTESGQMLSENDKIEKLISSLRDIDGAKFIRNAQEHTVDEAIAHMKKKWEWKRAEIKTAKDFITIAGSKSSVTGEPYLIKMPDGTVVKSEEWFRKQLRIIEKLPKKGERVHWGSKKTPDHPLTNIIQITAGNHHNLALKADGTIMGWGWNDYDNAEPPDGNNYIAIAAGDSHSLALKADGSIIGWGWNYFGQAIPPDGNDYVAIAACCNHSLALKSDGSIIGWGSNRFGQITPPDGNDYVAIAAGWFHSIALKADGSVVEWGSKPSGKSTSPNGNDYIAIAAGHGYSLALKADGSVVGWGFLPAPPKGNDYVAIAAGQSHCLALKADGSIIGWTQRGLNNYGQATPPKGNDFIAIAAGWDHGIALKADGSVVGWGANWSGQAEPQ